MPRYYNSEQEIGFAFSFLAPSVFRFICDMAYLRLLATCWRGERACAEKDV